jgi:hypothetical protein
MAPSRRNKESGLIQVSVWLREVDVAALREIGKRPEVDREWSWLVRKAMQEYIERDQQQGEAK